MKKRELHTLGIEIDQAIPIDKIPYIYFNFMKRMIIQRPRKIMKANDFTCPTDLLSGLNNLESKIINGDDLTPHLSKRVSMNYEGVDYLLNDWGIHHLHLGITMENGYVNRTDPVLFCKVTEDIIYFIDTKCHGEWSDQLLLTTIYKNWPDLIKPFIMHGVISLENKQTNEDIKKIRKGNVNHLIELEPGVVIYPPGGGYATDGTSNDVVAKVLKVMRVLSDFEEKIKTNENGISKKIIAKNKTLTRTLEFKLETKENDLIAYEVYSKMMFSYNNASL
jgi:hypothetical protein